MYIERSIIKKKVKVYKLSKGYRYVVQLMLKDNEGMPVFNDKEAKKRARIQVYGTKVYNKKPSENASLEVVKELEEKVNAEFKIWESRDFLTEEEFKKKLEAKERKARIEQRNPDNLILGEALTQFFERHIKTSGIKDTTISWYESGINNYLKTWKCWNWNINEISRDDIKDLYNSIEGSSESKFKSIQIPMNMLYEHLINDCIVVRNPVRKVKFTKPKKEKKRTAITIDQARKLISYFKDVVDQEGEITALILHVAVTTGLRIGEVFALSWKDIDLKNNILTVNKSVNRIKGKGLVLDSPKTESSTGREVFITEELAELFTKYKTAQKGYFKFKGYTNKFNLLFPDSVGNINDVDNWTKRKFKKYLYIHEYDNKKKQIKFQKEYQPELLDRIPDLPEGISFHFFRHTYTTIARTSGMADVVVKCQLGHSSQDVTDGYTHLTCEAINKARDIIKDKFTIYDCCTEKLG